MKAALFDLDGTLTDTERLWIMATAIAMRDDVGIANFTVDDATRIVYGRANNVIYDDLHALAPQYSIQQLDTFITARFEKIREKVTDEEVVISGGAKLLKRLHESGMKVAIVSGSPRDVLRKAIADHNFTPHVDLALGIEDYGESKPSPAGYAMAARIFGVEPKDCVVFEDATAGVKSALAAGMKCVAYRPPEHPPQDLSGATAVLDDLEKFTMEMI